MPCLGKVGAVAAREVSRFARNSRDWQQLIELCRVVDTLLIDQETVYAPRQGNDRLVLGLKHFADRQIAAGTQVVTDGHAGHNKEKLGRGARSRDSPRPVANAAWERRAGTLTFLR